MSLVKKTIKKYFSSFAYFYKYLGTRLFIVILLSIVVGVLDAFGLTMFLPLIKFADSNTMESVKGSEFENFEFLLNFFNKIGIEFSLKIALLTLSTIFVLKGVFNYLTNAYKVSVNQYFVSKLRLRLSYLFSKFSFKKFVVSDVGKIQNSFTTEVSRVSNAYNAYATCIQQIFMTVVYIVFVFIVDWRFALLVCLGGLFTNLLYRSVYKKTKVESSRLSKNNSDYQGLIIQYLTNFKYLKATGFLGVYAKKMEAAILNIEKNNKKIGLLNAVVASTREPVLVIVVCLVILVQVYLLGGELAAVMVSLLFFYRALTSLIGFQNSYNLFLSVSGSLESVELFEKELQEGAEQTGNQNVDKFNNQILLENVSFSYDSKRTILDKVNISIQKNQTVAFVGESGSGKTTIVNIICGLLKPVSGHVKVDEISLDGINLDSYQKRIGYIAQEPVVFSDTIFNNITFWDSPNEENIKRFQKAIEQASIKKFIEELPEKENTLLGNNGINLSGGQKQRISIARELYKEIDILILDEATSALDSETEREIQENIDKLKGNYTIVIIAHRLSTIKSADVICLMDQGRLSDQGNFDELIIKSDKFKRMVELQEI